MEERRRHNLPHERNNVPQNQDDNIEFRSTDDEKDGGQRKENVVEFHRTCSNDASPFQTQFPYYRTRTGLVLIVGAMLWTLFYFGVSLNFCYI